MSSSTRPEVTPAFVHALSLLAFQYRKSSQKSLTQIKEEVAVSYGFDGWQHLKNLEKKYVPVPIILSSEKNTRYDGRVTIDDYEGRRFFSMTIDKEIYDEESFKTVLKSTIGGITGYLWDSNNDGDIFSYFDILSADHSDFASFMKNNQKVFNGKYDFSVGSLALIDDLTIDSCYDEHFWGKAALKTFHNKLGVFVEAIFCQPIPTISIDGYKNNQPTLLYDFSKERVVGYRKIFESLGFERIADSEYWGLRNDHLNTLFDNQRSLKEL